VRRARTRGDVNSAPLSTVAWAGLLRRRSLDCVLLVAESAKHFARVPGPWPGTISRVPGPWPGTYIQPLRRKYTSWKAVLARIQPHDHQ
jgi:hypothetical protein